MPLKKCSEGNKPGYKWGDAGHCYTYTSGNPASQKDAKKKAIKQGIAIEGPDKFKKEVGEHVDVKLKSDDVKHYQDQAEDDKGAETITPKPHDDDSVDNFTVLELVREIERDDVDGLMKVKSQLKGE